jgi:hypothetical protein
MKGLEDLEGVRQSYLPAGRLRVLLIGESPPPTRGFFYTGDSTLYRFMAPLFVAECHNPRDKALFLRTFAESGWYLEDISGIRGDKPHRRPQDADVREAISRLAALIKDKGPTAVVGVLLEIRPLIREIVERCTRPETPWRCVRFPHYKSEAAQAEFLTGMRSVVRDYGCN